MRARISAVIVKTCFAVNWAPGVIGITLSREKQQIVFLSCQEEFKIWKKLSDQVIKHLLNSIGYHKISTWFVSFRLRQIIDLLVSSIGLIIWIGHREEIRKLTFRSDRSDQGLTLELSALDCSSPTQHQCFFTEKLTPIIDLFANDKSWYFAQPRPIIVNYYTLLSPSALSLVKSLQTTDYSPTC